MRKSNIVYKAEELSAFYSRHRIGWEKLYPSEKCVFDKMGLDSSDRVLDLGCACGGLGVALAERFGIRDYVGVDINKQCIEHAPKVCPWGTFINDDFLNVFDNFPHSFDLGLSLSAADWNIQTEAMLSALFSRIRVGGRLVLSCRLASERIVGECLEVEQYVCFEESLVESATETAPYKVYSLPKILRILRAIGNVAEIAGYGYWGKVPPSVRGLPVDRVFYLVATVSKAESRVAAPRLSLDVCTDLLT